MITNNEKNLYIGISTCLFIISRFILSLITPWLTGSKRSYALSLIVATFHSIISGVGSWMCIWLYYNGSEPAQNEMSIYFLIFSTSYFIYDILNTILTLPMNYANLSSIVHHIAVSIFFFCAIPVNCIYMSRYEAMSVNIAVIILGAELTMPTMNLQWIIDTYFVNRNDKIKKFSDILAGINIIVYFMFRILYSNFLVFWIIIPSGILTNVFLIGITMTLYLLNHIWFYKIVMKYRLRALSALRILRTLRTSTTFN